MMFPVGCKSTEQSELFLSFLNSWNEDAVGPNPPFLKEACTLCLSALGQWSTPRAEVLLQPDQACSETAFHRPLEEMFPVGCKSTVQSELFLSFPKSWKQDTLGPLSVFGNDSALCALEL